MSQEMSPALPGPYVALGFGVMLIQQLHPKEPGLFTAAQQHHFCFHQRTFTTAAVVPSCVAILNDWWCFWLWWTPAYIIIPPQCILAHRKCPECPFPALHD